MPGGGIRQLIQVDHHSCRSADDELQDCSAETSRRAGVRLLTERATTAVDRSGEETVGYEPCFGDQPPAARGIEI